jgi:diadenosine tetraphosphatase ApaH/serine/threonine PP2A family protein phosphatase
MRVAVISDVHSNLVALDAVLAAIGTVDSIWQLGDVVGYGPDPNGVVRRLREVAATGVRGNHDAAAIGGSEIDWFNPDARRAMEWTREVLEADSAAWLEALPERRSIGEVELVHGSPRQPLWEYITSPDVARANLDRLDARIGLHGHTHVPVAWRDVEGDVVLIDGDDGTELVLGDGAALVNPGSVGQPRDGDPRASYLLLDPETRRVTWHRVPYDVAEVQHAMRRVNLPAALVGRLAVGF